MAKVPINDPKYWRKRAEQARTAAGELTDPDSKRRMLRMANDYEKLARRAELRLKRQQQQQQQQQPIAFNSPSSLAQSASHAEILSHANLTVRSSRQNGAS